MAGTRRNLFFEGGGGGGKNDEFLDDEILLRGRVVPRPCYVVGRSSLVEATAAVTMSTSDEFLDDEMEELLAIGGDPTFLEQARGGSGEFEWDGVEDDAAHFDDFR